MRNIGKDFLYIYKYKIRTWRCLDGYGYKFTRDGEERISFNYWPSKMQAYNAAIDEIKTDEDMVVNLRKLEKMTDAHDYAAALEVFDKVRYTPPECYGFFMTHEEELTIKHALTIMQRVTAGELAVVPVEPEKGDSPYSFIQWKGTDVCMDFHCECGAHCHFDGDFAYTVKCPHCERVWEMTPYIFPKLASENTDSYWKENPKLLERDDDFDTTKAAPDVVSDK